MTARPLTGPRLRSRYRLVAVLAGTMLAVWAGVSAASAHSTLSSADPAVPETVQNAAQAVVLAFDEPAIAMGTEVVVTAPSGQVERGPARLADSTITADLTAKTAATTPPPSAPQTTPPATPAPTQRARMPASLKLAIGVGAIIFGVTVARRASRRGNAGRPD